MPGETGQLMTLSKTKWLGALRSGRVPPFRIADMIVRAQRNFAGVTLVFSEEAGLTPHSTGLLVTDVWVRAPRWLLAERHTSTRLS